MFIGSLFSGIGGLELGLERAGLGPVLWQVEQDAFCRHVLAKHWPNADRSVTDVRSAGPHNLCEVGIICGGFPCQDVSGAGLGAGLAGERSGLWYEFRRIVRDMQPRFVVVENVASGARRWLCEVRSGLQALGYRTRALGVAARDVGAPHIRERIFVVGDAGGVLREGPSRASETRCGSSWIVPEGPQVLAYADGLRGVQPEGTLEDQRRRAEDGRGDGSWRDVAYADGFSVRFEPGRSGWSSGPDAAQPERTGRRSSERGLGGGAHGLSSGLDGHRWPAARGEAQEEGEPPRTVTDRDPTRRARVRALGNAVVPQCAEIVGRAIQQMRGVPA